MKTKDYIITGLLGSILFCLFMLGDELHNIDDKYKNLLKEKQNVIDSYAEFYQQNQEYECNCGWYEDFYYEHAEEIGAME